MIYIQLFWSFFQICLFSIGGGYAAMPLIQHQVVELHGWLTMEQFADIITIAEMTPGPIAINSSTFVGTQIAGIPGALIATAGCVMPSCIIVLILAHIYYKYREMAMLQGVMQGLRPAVVSMIASAGLSIFCLSIFEGKAFPVQMTDINLISALLFGACLCWLRTKKPNPIAVMASAGAAGLLLYPIFT